MGSQRHGPLTWSTGVSLPGLERAEQGRGEGTRYAVVASCTLNSALKQRCLNRGILTPGFSMIPGDAERREDTEETAVCRDIPRRHFLGKQDSEMSPRGQKCHHIARVDGREVRV